MLTPPADGGGADQRTSLIVLIEPAQHARKRTAGTKLRRRQSSTAALSPPDAQAQTELVLGNSRNSFACYRGGGFALSTSLCWLLCPCWREVERRRTPTVLAGTNSYQVNSFRHFLVQKKPMPGIAIRHWADDQEIWGTFWPIVLARDGVLSSTCFH